MDCSKVYVAKSKFSTEDNEIDGAFASVDIKKGEIVEYGIARLLSDNIKKQFNGM